MDHCIYFSHLSFKNLDKSIKDKLKYVDRLPNGIFVGCMSGHPGEKALHPTFFEEATGFEDRSDML